MEKGILNYLPMQGPSAKSGWHVETANGKVFLHRDSEGYPFNRLCGKEVQGMLQGGYFKIQLPADSGGEINADENKSL